MQSTISKVLVLVAAASITACSGDDLGGTTPQTGTAACAAAGQKQFVLDNMYAWYLWSDLLPQNVNVDDYSSPDELLAFLTSFSPDDGNGNPIDRFSFINSAQADAAFFGEGQFEGFGFSTRFLAADDLRFARVFASSPAAAAGFARGQRILTLNGRTIAEIEAAEGVGTVFDTTPVEFTIRRLDDSEFTVSIDKDIVTIDPVPQHRVIDNNGTPVGYMELATFISTADAELNTVFTDFVNAGVNDVIIDLRYNGGGLVSTAELLGDYLGGSIAQNLVFSETMFNDDRSGANNSVEFFELRASSLSLSRLVIIATRSTASASELVTNALEPHAQEVVIVGDRTFGKPVGQIGLEFCEQILRPTAFQTINAAGFGDYFGGLPADCTAADDLSVAVGDDQDPNIVAALAYLAPGGGCPVTAVPGGFAKPADGRDVQQLDRRGPPWREFAEAF